MKNNIAAIRKSRGLSQQDLAEQLGMHWTNLSKIERDKSDPGMDRFQQIADTLGIEVADLFTSDSPDLDASSGNEDDGSMGLPFAGIAQAGVFVAVDLYHDDRQRYVPIAPDPRFKRAKQYVWQVQGDSMNKAGLHPGMWAVGVDYVDFAEMYRPVQPGDIVVVERLRFDGQERELTVKRYWEEAGGVALIPESTNDKHKAIFIPRDGEIVGEQIRILAYVASAHSLFGKSIYEIDDGHIALSA